MSDADVTITITLKLKKAQNLSEGMADLLCWCGGFQAGSSDSTHWPMGVDETREVRLALLDAIRKATP